ncbi:MAG: helix-turn-helix domain-containing protein [Pseudobdellovibrionaceae bacterium]
MAITEQKRMTSVANVMKRLRENAGLTTRQAAGIISVTHTTISHFETGRRDFPSLRIEQLVKGYGYTMEEFEKILGHRSVKSHKDDCVTMIGQLDDDQLSAIRSVLSQMLRNSRKQIAANEPVETQK